MLGSGRDLNLLQRLQEGKCIRRNPADRIGKDNLLNPACRNSLQCMRQNGMIIRRKNQRSVRSDLKHGSTAERQNTGAFLHQLRNSLALGKRNNL